MDAAVVGNEMTGTRPEPAAEGDAVDPFGGRDLEPPLLIALTLGGVTLAWGSGAGRGAWTAAGTLGVLAGSAWLARRRDRRPPAFALRASRAGLALGAATVAVGVGHGTPAALLAWFPAVCAVYTLVFAGGAATTFATATLGVLAVLAAEPPSRGPSETAFAACAVAVLAVSLASRTLRAVLSALRGARRNVAAPAVPAVPGTTRTAVVVPEPAAPRPDAVAVPRPASLPDRDQLLHAVARAQSRVGVVGGEVGLLVLTLQGAGSLAASLGAAPAQEVLETLARRARAWLPAGDVVAWLADGRLAVLLEGVDAGTCAVVARRLAALLAEPVPAGRDVVSLPSAAALALADGPQESPAELLRRAEHAPPLDDSLLAGTARPTRAAILPDALAADLGPALAGGEVSVALQPIIALGTLPRHDRVVAFEALARWTRADGTSVPPSRFVPAARRSGLADLLGVTVLAQGLDALRDRRTTDAAAGLSVNVAPEQLTDPGVAAAILRAVESAGVEPSALIVEVPAATAFEDAAVARAVLGTLRDAGVGVVLDNFGAAGLSIAALRELPLTGVKLDRSLTADLGVDDRLVVATVRLTTRLGLACTAVGVETQTQLDAARSLGIDAVQGHLLGRPESIRTPAVVSAAGAPVRAHG
jgi:EAL domain-containing protein (putative c-di-GMP-specific phosphodiesterase class I)/GGDEF domain-containing protein